MIASFLNNNGEHRITAEQRKGNADEDWTKSALPFLSKSEAIEVSYKEQNFGPITIRRDVATTTSNRKPISYKNAKKKQKDTNQM